MLDPVVVKLTAAGYLYLSQRLAQHYFPQDTLVVFRRQEQLVLLPTRGPAGGGLILKQRNKQGDRVVLLSELFEFHEIPGGDYTACWDEQLQAVVLHPTANVLHPTSSELT